MRRGSRRRYDTFQKRRLLSLSVYAMYERLKEEGDIVGRR